MTPARRSVAALALLCCAAAGCGSDIGAEGSAQTDGAFGKANPYGVNAHGARDELLDTFLGIGIGWYRVDCEWSVNEPQDGVFDWSLTDRLVSTIKARGAFVKIDAAYTPSWASGTNNTAAPPKDPARFVAYVREVARRYRGQADCMGVWNEPNLKQFWAGGKSQFISDILVPSLQAIKEEAPEMVTCGPDLSSSGNARKDWLEPILNAAGPLLDVITHHQYDGNDSVSGRVSEIDKTHQFLVDRGYGSRPLWITEIGWDRPKYSAAKQAQNLQGIMGAMASRPWWQKTFWYDSHGGGWGLLDGEGGEPTQSFFAYANVISGSPYAPGDEDPANPQDPPPNVPAVPGDDVLGSGETLEPGAQVTSADGRFSLVYQGDGNLVLYQGGEPLWSSQTPDTSPGVATMQGDGNFVVYDGGGAPVWSTGTVDHPGAHVAVQTDGNMVVYGTDGAMLWNSGTCCH